MFQLTIIIDKSNKPTGPFMDSKVRIWPQRSPVVYKHALGIIRLLGFALVMIPGITPANPIII
ncbi:hypothetical protein ES703_54665 [subsurface metagenome]